MEYRISNPHPKYLEKNQKKINHQFTLHKKNVSFINKLINKEIIKIKTHAKTAVAIASLINLF